MASDLDSLPEAMLGGNASNSRKVNSSAGITNRGCVAARIGKIVKLYLFWWNPRGYEDDSTYKEFP